MKTTNALFALALALWPISAKAILYEEVLNDVQSATWLSYVPSWEITYQAGGGFSPELLGTANGSQTTDHVWALPESLTLTYDLAGNLTATAGPDSLVFQPLSGFNAIFVQVYDRGTLLGPAELTDGIINDHFFSDLSADSSTGTPATSQAGIFDDGGVLFDELDMSWTFNFDELFASGDSSRIELRGVMRPLTGPGSGTLPTPGGDPGGAGPIPLIPINGGGGDPGDNGDPGNGGDPGDGHAVPDGGNTFGLLALVLAGLVGVRRLKRR